MALTTKTIKTVDEDLTPEYYTALDSEGKGYLAKREVKPEPVETVEEPIEEIKPKKKKKAKK